MQSAVSGAGENDGCPYNQKGTVTHGAFKLYILIRSY